MSYTRMGSNPVHGSLTTLLFVNYSINPFIYIWRLKNYRITLKMLLRELGFYSVRGIVAFTLAADSYHVQVDTQATATWNAS